MTEQDQLGALLSIPLQNQTEEEALQEAKALEDFVVQYSEQYQFADPGSGESPFFSSVLKTLLEQRLINLEWQTSVPPDRQLLVLQCLRLLTRDGELRKELLQNGGVQAVGQIFERYAEDHCSGIHSPYQVEILTECAAIVKRLVGDESGIECLVECNVHKTLVCLLNSSDPTILPLVLVAMLGFAAHAEHYMLVASPDTLEVLLVMVQQYDPTFKRLAAELLAVLSRRGSVVADLVHIGCPGRVLGQLQSGDSALVQQLLRLLCHLASYRPAVQEVQQVGGIPMITSLASLTASEAASPHTIPLSRLAELQLVCAAIARLAESHDDVGYQIRQCNGVCLLGRLLLLSPRNMDDGPDKPAEKQAAELQAVRAHALRALRYLFSIERIRKVFKRLFPPDLFSRFIDLGHFNPSLPAYAALVDALDELSQEQRAGIAAALEDINMDSEAGLRTIQGYVILELLGRGAFGAVYRARRQKSEAMVALKELPLSDKAIFGGTEAERTAGLGRMSKEVEILSSLQHPNIVQYQECVVEGGQLYIAMELVEGPTLMDHLSSLSQRQRRMPEQDVWQVLIALVLALNYMHCSKRVIHRDLTPSNIVLGQGPDGLRHTKITDFGLAKCVATTSTSQSMVGTMPYTCPEIIQQEQYSEKADMWSLGCVLYHMLMLHPPFKGSNPLSVASKIVEGAFQPITDPPDAPPYSDTLRQLVGMLLTTDPNKRPSIDMVGAAIAPQLMAAMDRMAAQESVLSRALHAERQHRRTFSDLSARKMDAYRKLQNLPRDLIIPGSDTCSMTSLANSPSGSAMDLSTLGDGYTGFTPASSPPPGSYPSLSCGNLPSPSFSPAAGRTVSIAQSRLRPVSDPCAQLLQQLHKVVWVEQLPPGLTRDPRRRCIELFSRRLFAMGSNSGTLKMQLAKLLSGSLDIVADAEGPIDLGPLPLGDGKVTIGGMVTYEQLQVLLEALLEERGYYSQLQNAD